MGIEARRREEACAGGHALAHLFREMPRGALGSGVLKCSQHMAYFALPRGRVGGLTRTGLHTICMPLLLRAEARGC